MMSTTLENGMSMKTDTDQHYTIYVDLDGVLADFYKGATKAMRDIGADDTLVYKDEHDQNKKDRDALWKAIYAYQQKFGYVLWRNLDTLPDAYQLWDYVKTYNPQILTAAGPPRYHATEQKRGWVTEHFGSNVRVNSVERAMLKATFATPSSILIDDKMKAIGPWVSAGGIGIHHTSAANTIQQLKQLGL